MEQNKQPKVESNQPIEQPKSKSVKSKPIGQYVSNGVKLMLYGAVIMVMGIGLLWSFNGASQPPSTAQEPTTESTPIAEMTIEAVITRVNGYCDSGEIKGQGLCNSLLSKLEAAIEARDRGQPEVVCNQLNAFINEVEAQNENKIPADVATKLIDAANLACSKLPPTVEPSATPIAEISPSPTSIPNTPTLTPPPNFVTTVEIPGGGSYNVYDPKFTSGATYTPSPVVSPTPTDVPAVQLVSDEPLLSPEILAQMQAEDTGHIWVVAWPSEDEIILGMGYDRANPIYWSFSPVNNMVQRTTYSHSTAIEAKAIEELRQFDERVDRVYISPNEQWVAWGQGKTLLVKQLDASKSPINLLGKVEYEEFWSALGSLVWSPQSSKLAYVIKYSGFQVRISDPSGQNIQTIYLKRTPPSHLSWSADEQFLAFNMLKEPQSGIENLYVVKSDGTGLVELLEHGLVNGPILWSPAGHTIIYHNNGYDLPWRVEIEAQGRR